MHLMVLIQKVGTVTPSSDGDFEKINRKNGKLPIEHKTQCIASTWETEQKVVNFKAILG